MSIRSRSFIIEINNNKSKDVMILLKMKYVYIIVSYIDSHNTKTLIYNKNKMSQKSLSCILPHAIITKPEGSVQNNIKELKDNVFFIEYGIAPLQGKRTDIINKKENTIVSKISKEDNIKQLTLNLRSCINDANQAAREIKNLRLDVEYGKTPTDIKKAQTRLDSLLSKKPSLLNKIKEARAKLDKVLITN